MMLTLESLIIKFHGDYGGLSMAYEIFEWLLTVFLSPEDADSYNGQQGDMWDAQKDMALALVGSTLSAIWIYLIERRQMKQTSTQK